MGACVQGGLAAPPPACNDVCERSPRDTSAMRAGPPAHAVELGVSRCTELSNTSPGEAMTAPRGKVHPMRQSSTVACVARRPAWWQAADARQASCSGACSLQPSTR